MIARPDPNVLTQCSFDEPLVSYFQYPETPDEQGDIERRLLRVRAEVDEMFLGGLGQASKVSVSVNLSKKV